MAKGPRGGTICSVRTAGEEQKGDIVHTDQRNYGDVEGQGRMAMSAQDERTWSVLSHLSMFLNLVTGFLGPVAALVIWLIYLIPVMAVVSVVPCVHAGYAAYRVSQGDDYRYPIAADVVESR